MYTDEEDDDDEEAPRRKNEKNEAVVMGVSFVSSFSESI
jgi:hypothetical protein